MSQGVGALDALAVTRATLAYNQTQDRISLTCALKNEECVVLWLTARLATQLAPHLCQAVTQMPDTHPTNGDPTVTDHDEPTSADALDRDKTPIAGSAQERAPEAPVVAGADSATWVVTAIDLTNGPMLVQLGFRDDQGHAPVLLSLEHTQLAEWSEGLKRCYAQAGWPMDCWHMPAGASPQSHATRRVALH
jgi:hypothetical protein